MASKKESQARPMRLPRSPFLSPARKAGDLAMMPLADALGERGFAGPEIIAQWAGIVGAELAKITAPERIQWPHQDLAQDGASNRRDHGATLHIRAEGPGAIEVQHCADLILERVNQYLGFQAVTRLRILQAPVRKAQQTDSARKVTYVPTQLQETQQIEGIMEPGLKTALMRLQAGMRARRG